jgi:hypothetical protein
MSRSDSFVDCETFWGRCSCRTNGEYMHPMNRIELPDDERDGVKEEDKIIKESSP